MIKLGFSKLDMSEVDKSYWENRILTDMLNLALDMMPPEEYEAFKLAWAQRKFLLPAPPCVCLASQEHDGQAN